MSPDGRRARDIQREIAAILLRTWDPIGIQDEPGCLDEYDGYVGGVYRLLASGADDGALVEHLAGLESREMGLPARDPQTLQKVVEELRSVRIRAVHP
jgi:hypothetical protein